MKYPQDALLSNLKGGLRIGAGLLVLSLINFNVSGPANDPSSGAYNWIQSACMWAGVTLVRRCATLAVQRRHDTMSIRRQLDCECGMILPLLACSRC